MFPNHGEHQNAVSAFRNKVYAALTPQPPRQPAHAGAAKIGLAVVIGNTEYTTVTRLPQAEQDAKQMATKLQQLGYHVLGRVEQASSAGLEEPPELATVLT